MSEEGNAIPAQPNMESVAVYEGSGLSSGAMADERDANSDQKQQESSTADSGASAGQTEVTQPSTNESVTVDETRQAPTGSESSSEAVTSTDVARNDRHETADSVTVSQVEPELSERIEPADRHAESAQRNDPQQPEEPSTKIETASADVGKADEGADAAKSSEIGSESQPVSVDPDAFIASAISQPPSAAHVSSNDPASSQRRSASPDVKAGSSQPPRFSPHADRAVPTIPPPREFRDYPEEPRQRGRGARGGRGRFRGSGSPPPAQGQRYTPNYSAGGNDSWNDRRRGHSPGPPEDWRPRGEKRRSSRERDGRNERDRIHERSEQERPCRVLFCRNINYETPLRMVEERFRRFGEVKSVFDLISKRGMVFITYYDLRSAELARTSMSGAQINNRTIDVHYSLPRDSDIRQGCDRDKNQGTLLITVEGAREPILVNMIRDRFGRFGDIKHITPSNKRQTDTYIEFWDSRATARAYDTLNDSAMAGGRMLLQWTWDMEPPLIRQSQQALGNFYNAPQSVNERLEQAQKMQALLSNLVPGAAPGGPMGQPPPMQQMGMPPMPPQQNGYMQHQGGYPPYQQQGPPHGYGQPMGYGQPPQQPGMMGGPPMGNMYGQQPPQGYMNQYPPQHAYSPPPPHQQSQAGMGAFSPPPAQQPQMSSYNNAPAAGPGNLPPALMALLQNQGQNPNQAQGQASQQMQYGQPPASASSMPPSSAYSPQYGGAAKPAPSPYASSYHSAPPPQRQPQPPSQQQAYQQYGSSSGGYRSSEPNGNAYGSMNGGGQQQAQPPHQQQQQQQQQSNYGRPQGGAPATAPPSQGSAQQSPSTPAQVQALLSLLAQGNR